MEFPSSLKYTKEHEWTRIEDRRATIGITDFAQDELGDVVYVELPAVGKTITQMSTFGVVESVKAVSDLYTPVSGTVVEVNKKLEEHPELVNTDPYGEGWMLIVEMSNPSEIDTLLTAEEYQAYLKQQGTS
jgi:glycine cleavage system H protein